MKKNHSISKQFGIRFRHCLLRCADIKTASNTNAQHALGRWFSSPRPRNYKMYISDDTTHFPGIWLVDSSHRNTVARVLPSRGKVVKRWPVRGYKRVGDSVYLSNTYCICERLFGTPRRRVREVHCTRTPEVLRPGRMKVCTLSGFSQTARSYAQLQ